MLDSHKVDFESLFKLRLVVARYGEMDGAKWWNTKGMLGPYGAKILRRGFPSTHYFAQAKVVFAVARTRCEKLFNPPGCMTLWHLPADLEDQFETKWHDWLDDRESWSEFFEKLSSIGSGDLLKEIQSMDLIDKREVDAVEKLRRSAEGKAVPLPGIHQPTNEVLSMLAAGFSRGEPSKPAIPYARIEE